nr:MAG TPA: hypothetical protein [Caudoviricetes sp.]
MEILLILYKLEMVAWSQSSEQECVKRLSSYEEAKALM